MGLSRYLAKLAGFLGTDGKVSAAGLAAGAATSNLGYTPLNAANNLSDLANVGSARTSLGLGTLATKSTVGIADYSATGTPSASSFLRGDNTWSAVPASNDASALTTGTLSVARIADASLTAAKLASGAAASNLGGYVSAVDGSTGSVTLANLGVFTRSLATNGYQKLPGGLIIQWGAAGTTAGTYSFAIAFPSACVMAVATFAAAGSSGGACQTSVILAKSTTAVTIGYKDYASASVNGVNWIAIGY